MPALIPLRLSSPVIPLSTAPTAFPAFPQLYVPSAPADPGPGVPMLLDLPLSLHCGQALPRHPTKHLTKCCLFWTGLRPAHFRKPCAPVTDVSVACDSSYEWESERVREESPFTRHYQPYRLIPPWPSCQKISASLGILCRGF